MAIFSFPYIIYVHLYLVYIENGINSKSAFNVTKFENVLKIVTLTYILNLLKDKKLFHIQEHP